MKYKDYCKSVVIKTVWCWLRDRTIDQRNRRDSPEIGCCFYGHLRWIAEPEGRTDFAIDGAGTAERSYVGLGEGE